MRKGKIRKRKTENEDSQSKNKNLKTTINCSVCNSSFTSDYPSVKKCANCRNSDEPNSNQVVTPTPSTMVNEIGAELQACTPVADETMDEITSSSENDTESTSEIDFLEETAADLNTKMSERSFF